MHIDTRVLSLDLFFAARVYTMRISFFKRIIVARSEKRPLGKTSALFPENFRVRSPFFVLFRLFANNNRIRRLFCEIDDPLTL